MKGKRFMNFECWAFSLVESHASQVQEFVVCPTIRNKPKRSDVGGLELDVAKSEFTKPR